MPTADFSSASYRRILDDNLRQAFAAERQYQNARYHYRVVVKGGDTAALLKAEEVLNAAEQERNYTIGLAEFAHKALLECELAEATAMKLAHEFGAKFEGPSTASNVLPFVQDAG